jgi:hypothetical protein
MRTGSASGSSRLDLQDPDLSKRAPTTDPCSLLATGHSKVVLLIAAETATPSLTMVASIRKRRSWSYNRPQELILLALFIAVLLSSISLFRSATLSDWNVDHDCLSIDPPILSRPSSASLAYRQSYGFFNDISDQNWRLIQQRAQRVHTLVEQEHRLMPGSSRDSPSMWYPNDLEVSPSLDRQETEDAF